MHGCAVVIPMGRKNLAGGVEEQSDDTPGYSYSRLTTPEGASRLEAVPQNRQNQGQTALAGSPILPSDLAVAMFAK